MGILLDPHSPSSRLHAASSSVAVESGAPQMSDIAASELFQRFRDCLRSTLRQAGWINEKDRICRDKLFPDLPPVAISAGFKEVVERPVPICFTIDDQKRRQIVQYLNRHKDPELDYASFLKGEMKGKGVCKRTISDQYVDILKILYGAYKEQSGKSDARLRGGFLRHLLRHWMVEAISLLKVDLVAEELIRHLEEMPADMDAFFNGIGGKSPAHGVPFHASLIERWANRLNKNPSFKKCYEVMLALTILKKKPEFSNGANEYKIVSLQSEERPDLEVILAEKFARFNLCLLDVFAISLTEYLEGTSSDLPDVLLNTPEQAWQGIIDNLLYLIHYDNIETVDLYGLARHYSHLALGARASEAKTAHRLWNNFDYRSEGFVKSFIDHLERCEKNHLPRGAPVLHAMMLNALSSLQEEGIPQETLRTFVLEMNRKMAIYQEDLSDETLFGSVLFQVHEQNISYPTAQASVQLLTYLSYVFPTEDNAVAETNHEETEFLHVKENGTFWIVSSDLKSALAQLEKNPEEAKLALEQFSRFFPLGTTPRKGIEKLDIERATQLIQQLDVTPSVRAPLMVCLCRLNVNLESTISALTAIAETDEEKEPFIDQLKQFISPVIPDVDRFFDHVNVESKEEVASTIPLALTHQPDSKCQAYGFELWKKLPPDLKKKVGIELLGMVNSAFLSPCIRVFRHMQADNLLSKEELYEEFSKLLAVCRLVAKQRSVVLEADLLRSLVENLTSLPEPEKKHVKGKKGDKPRSAQIPEANLIWLVQQTANPKDLLGLFLKHGMLRPNGDAIQGLYKDMIHKALKESEDVELVLDLYAEFDYAKRSDCEFMIALCEKLCVKKHSKLIAFAEAAAALPLSAPLQHRLNQIVEHIQFPCELWVLKTPLLLLLSPEKREPLVVSMITKIKVEEVIPHLKPFTQEEKQKYALIVLDRCASGNAQLEFLFLAIEKMIPQFSPGRIKAYSKLCLQSTKNKGIVKAFVERLVDMNELENAYGLNGEIASECVNGRAPKSEWVECLLKLKQYETARSLLVKLKPTDSLRKAAVLILTHISPLSALKLIAQYHLPDQILGPLKKMHMSGTAADKKQFKEVVASLRAADCLSKTSEVLQEVIAVFASIQDSELFKLKDEVKSLNDAVLFRAFFKAVLNQFNQSKEQSMLASLLIEIEAELQDESLLQQLASLFLASKNGTVQKSGKECCEKAKERYPRSLSALEYFAKLKHPAICFLLSDWLTEMTDNLKDPENKLSKVVTKIIENLTAVDDIEATRKALKLLTSVYCFEMSTSEKKCLERPLVFKQVKHARQTKTIEDVGFAYTLYLKHLDSFIASTKENEQIHSMILELFTQVILTQATQIESAQFVVETVEGLLGEATSHFMSAGGASVVSLGQGSIQDENALFREVMNIYNKAKDKKAVQSIPSERRKLVWNFLYPLIEHFISVETQDLNYKAFCIEKSRVYLACLLHEFAADKNDELAQLVHRFIFVKVPAKPVHSHSVFIDHFAFIWDIAIKKLDWKKHSNLKLEVALFLSFQFTILDFTNHELMSFMCFFTKFMDKLLATKCPHMIGRAISILDTVQEIVPEALVCDFLHSHYKAIMESVSDLEGYELMYAVDDKMVQGNLLLLLANSIPRSRLFQRRRISPRQQEKMNFISDQFISLSCNLVRKNPASHEARSFLSGAVRFLHDSIFNEVYQSGSLYFDHVDWVYQAFYQRLQAIPDKYDEHIKLTPWSLLSMRENGNVDSPSIAFKMTPALSKRRVEIFHKHIDRLFSFESYDCYAYVADLMDQAIDQGGFYGVSEECLTKLGEITIKFTDFVIKKGQQQSRTPQSMALAAITLRLYVQQQNRLDPSAKRIHVLMALVSSFAGDHGWDLPVSKLSAAELAGLEDAMYGCFGWFAALVEEDPAKAIDETKKLFSIAILSDSLFMVAAQLKTMIEAGTLITSDIEDRLANALTDFESRTKVEAGHPNTLLKMYDDILERQARAVVMLWNDYLLKLSQDPRRKHLAIALLKASKEDWKWYSVDPDHERYFELTQKSLSGQSDALQAQTSTACDERLSWEGL